jgi:hypothetical protein
VQHTFGSRLNLTAMSRATMDLGMAGRLRAMASEFQTKATEQEDEQTETDLELATHSSPVRKLS